MFSLDVEVDSIIFSPCLGGQNGVGTSSTSYIGLQCGIGSLPNAARCGGAESVSTEFVVENLLSDLCVSAVVPAVAVVVEGNFSSVCGVDDGGICSVKNKSMAFEVACATRDSGVCRVG